MQTGVYFSVRPLHYRRDDFAPGCTKTLEAKWYRDTLMRRFILQADEEMPYQVPVNTTAKYINSIKSVLSADGGDFISTDQRQLASIRVTVKQIQWENIITHAYAVPVNPDSGLVYSPAFNSIYISYDKTTQQLSHFMIVAANADGAAQTRYIGNSYNTMFESVANYLYTPLTGSTKNPLYFALPEFDPLDWQVPWLFNIEMWYADHPPPAPSYIWVNSTMVCTTDPSQTPVQDQVNAKEYYMGALIEAYQGQDAAENSAMSVAKDAFDTSLHPTEKLGACQPVAEQYKLLLDSGFCDSATDALPWEIPPTCV